MKSSLAFLLLASVIGGCRMPWSPEWGPIIGKVVYPDGTAARTAQVHVVNGGTTYTSYDGGFHLSVPAGDDSLTVVASDSFDGRTYGSTHSGSVRIKPAHGPSIVRIVLSVATPI